MTATQVDVALMGIELGTSFDGVMSGWMTPPSEDGELQGSWDELPRVSLLVDQAESLDAILNEASSRFGLVEKRDWVGGFATGRFIALRDDSSPLALKQRLTDVLTLVDEDGRAIWVWDFKAVTYQQVRTAVAAGALHGDPAQLYLHVRYIPAGGGVLPSWNLVLDAWAFAWTAVQALSTLNDLVDLREKVRSRLAGYQDVTRRTEDWLRRNVTTLQVERLLGGENLKARDLAGLLGCTVSEAQSVLKLYGYRQEPSSDVWVYTAGDPAQPGTATDADAWVVVALRKGIMGEYADGVADETDVAALLRTLLERADRASRGSDDSSN